MTEQLIMNSRTTVPFVRPVSGANGYLLPFSRVQGEFGLLRQATQGSKRGNSDRSDRAGCTTVARRGGTDLASRQAGRQAGRH